jgi:hypothetical protein
MTTLRWRTIVVRLEFNLFILRPLLIKPAMWKRLKQHSFQHHLNRRPNRNVCQSISMPSEIVTAQLLYRESR